MDILFSSAFALLVLFLITQFLDSKHRKILQKFAILGVLIGLFSILYVSFFQNSRTIANPIRIKTENGSNENLKVYAIAFAKDAADTLSTKVVFDKEMLPSSSSEFSIDKSNTGNFWIVAKNQTNAIRHLSKYSENDSEVVLNISKTASFDETNAQTARELIFAKDINNQVLNFAIWSNIALMIMLIWGFYKLRKV